MADGQGDLSTIVMDGVSGKTAVGVVVEVYALGDGAPRKVAQAVTGADGRAALIESGPLRTDVYELRFQTADYFRSQGVAVGEPAVLDMVVVRFSITEPTGHYHIPLICTPSGYTTYRGS
jgi:hydroxyisourate hydrolase